MRQARRRLSSTVSQTSVFSEQTEAYFFLFGCAFFVKRNPQAKQENLHKNPRGNRSGRQERNGGRQKPALFLRHRSLDLHGTRARRCLGSAPSACAQPGPSLTASTEARYAQPCCFDLLQGKRQHTDADSKTDQEAWSWKVSLSFGCTWERAAGWS